MTTPTQSDVHVNRPLTNMSVAFMQSLLKFRADALAPIMPSDKKSNSYFILNKEYWFSDIMRERAAGTPAIRLGYGVSQDSFLCKLFSLGKDIDDQTRANEDAPLNSDRTAMQFVSRASLMNREKAFKAAAFGTGIWTTNLVGNSSASAIIASQTFQKWNQAGSTPIEDMAIMMQLIEKLTGFTPNVLALSRPAWEALKANAEIISRITGGATVVNPAKVTPQLVAALLEIDDIEILSAVENTAGHGNTMTGSYIFGNDAVLMYRDSTVGIETPTAIRTITWQQYAGAANGVRILKWRDETIHSDVIEIESTYVHKVIAPDMGIYLQGVV